MQIDILLEAICLLTPDSNMNTGRKSFGNKESISDKRIGDSIKVP